MSASPDSFHAADPSVLAMDNIPLELPVAGVGSRALAATLDYLLVAVLGALWITTLVWLTPRLRPLLGSGWTFALMFIGMFVLEYGYFAGIEAATGGRSVGKSALGLQVVSRDGGRAPVGALLL